MITDTERLKKELQLLQLPDYDNSMVHMEDVFNLIDNYTKEPTESNERAIKTYYAGYNLND